MTKSIQKKKKYKKAKQSVEDLQIAKERRETIGKGERERYPTECRVPENTKERHKSLLKRTVQRNR